MLVDPRKPQYRARAVAQILKIREAIREEQRLEKEGAAKKKRGRKPKKPSVRIFRKPQSINLEATSYPDLIDWDNLENLEPPLTRNISDEDLQNFVHNWNFLKLPRVPNHTQAVERMVGVCAGIAARFKKPEMRTAQIRLKIKYNTKKRSS